MATASARLEVNDEGAVETITVAGEKFEKLAQSTDDAGSELSELEQKLQQLEKGFGGTKEELFDLKEEIKELGGIEALPKGFSASKISELGSISEETGVQFSKLAKEVDFARESSGEIWDQIDELEEKLESAGKSALEFSDDTGSVSTSTQEATEELNGLNEAAEKYKQKISEIGPERIQPQEQTQQTGRDLGFERIGDTSDEATRLTNSLGTLQDKAESAGRSMNKFGGGLNDVQRRLIQAREAGESISFERAFEEANQDIRDVEGKTIALANAADQTGVAIGKIASNVNWTENFGDSITELVNKLNDGTIAAEDLNNQFEIVDPTLAEFADKMDLVGRFTDEANRSLKNTANRLNGLRNDYFDATKGAEEYSNAIRGVEVRSTSSSEAIRDQVQSLSVAEQQIAENTIRAKQLQEQQRSLQTTTSANVGSFRAFSGEGAHVNEILFSTGDAIQDAQFGLRGMGNNLAFMAENFVQAGAQAGSFSKVLKGVVAGLTGPLGIIVGLQTLLALGPQIVKFFNSSSESASDFEKSVKDAAESLISFEESVSGFAAENIDQMESAKSTLEDRVETRQEEIKELEKLQTFLGRQGSQLNNINEITEEQANEIAKRNDLENAGVHEVGRRIDKLQKDLTIAKQGVETAETRLKTRRGQLALQETLNEENLETEESQEKQKKNLREVQLEVVEINNELLNANDTLNTLANKDFDTSLGIETGDILQSVDDVQGFFEAGFLDSIDKTEQALNVLDEKLGKVEGTGEEAQQERTRIQNLIEQIETLQKEFKGTEESSDKAFKSVDALSNALDEGDINTPKKVANAISFLESKLETTKFESEDAREEIKRLLKILRGLNNQAKKTGNKGVQQLATEIDSFSGGISKIFDNVDKVGQLTRILTQNFTELGKAIGQGEKVMQSFGKAALGVLGDVASAIGQILIKQGAAMIASALIPGQQANALVGAKLVAAGSALVATSATLGGALSGGGASGGGGNSRRREVSGGGEGGFDPGGDNSRRRGGPVQGGQLYETHGLGNREFFVPNMDGAIMTQAQMRSTSQNRQRDIRVTTENRLEGSIDGPDLFELDTRLKEVEQFKDKFARQ